MIPGLASAGEFASYTKSGGIESARAGTVEMAIRVQAIKPVIRVDPLRSMG